MGLRSPGPGARQSIGYCEFEIVWSIGNQLVAEGALDLMVLQQEGPRHALHVSSRQQGKIAFHPRHQHAIDAFAVQILTQFGAGQPEHFVELSVRGGKSGKIVQFIWSKKLGSTFFGAEMNKRDARAFGLNLCTKAGELGDRLAAERSTKMPQEDE